MFENQPKGLWALALANTGERFGYYTMLAVFLLYLQANFGYATGTASTIYSTFLMMVYFLPIIGGIAADKFGFGKMVTSGIFIMFIGYLVLSLPLGKDMVAAGAMGLALVLIAFGTGLFKGNLQVMVGLCTTSRSMRRTATLVSRSSTWLSTSVRCSLLQQLSKLWIGTGKPRCVGRRFLPLRFRRSMCIAHR